MVTKGYIIKYADGTYRGAKRWRPTFAGYAQVYKRAREAIKYARDSGGTVIEVNIEELNTLT